MFKTLRILFTILSAICIALIIPVGAFFGWFWAIAGALLAVLFFVIMLIFKQSHERQEQTNVPSETSTSPVLNDDEKPQE